MADGPVGIVRQAVDGLDAHHRAFKGGHAVKADADHHHPDHRIGAQLVPGTRQRHQTVDHAAPRRHPQDHRHHHAQRPGPVRQRGVVQVVRASPDVEEDQGPEVDDRQLVAVDRALGLLGHEVIHHAQETGGQEKAHRVVAIPPLDHRILHAAGDLHRLAAEDRHRNGHVVDQMQHGDGDDEGQIEPVRHIDMRLLALHDGAGKDDQEGHPDDGDPPVDVPDRLGIFARLRAAKDIA